MIKPWLLRRLEKELADHPFTLASDGDETVCFSFGKYAVTAHVGSNYPFYPPLLTIDGKPFSYTPSFFPQNMLASLTSCPCCVSITCPENWSPALGILDILREFVAFVETLKMFAQNADVQKGGSAG